MPTFSQLKALLMHFVKISPMKVNVNSQLKETFAIFESL